MVSPGTVAGDTPDGRSDVALFDTFAGRRHALERVQEMLADRDIGKVVLYTWDAPTAFLDDITALRIDGVIMKSETGERLVDALERVYRGEPIGLDPRRDPSDGADRTRARSSCADRTGFLQS